jgi:hypothetical protein
LIGTPRIYLFRSPVHGVMHDDTQNMVRTHVILRTFLYASTISHFYSRAGVSGPRICTAGERCDNRHRHCMHVGDSHRHQIAKFLESEPPYSTAPCIYPLICRVFFVGAQDVTTTCHRRQSWTRGTLLNSHSVHPPNEHKQGKHTKQLPWVCLFHCTLAFPAVFQADTKPRIFIPHVV